MGRSKNSCIFDRYIVYSNYFRESIRLRNPPFPVSNFVSGLCSCIWNYSEMGILVESGGKCNALQLRLAVPSRRVGYGMGFDVDSYPCIPRIERHLAL